VVLDVGSGLVAPDEIAKQVGQGLGQLCAAVQVCEAARFGGAGVEAEVVGYAMHLAAVGAAQVYDVACHRFTTRALQRLAPMQTGPQGWS
jgi:hypothetical protein